MSGKELWFLFIFIPNVGALSCILGIIFIISTIIAAIGVMDAKADNDDKLAGKRFILAKKLFIVATISSIISCTIPSQKEMAFITVGPNIINNQEVQKLPENLVKYINNILEEKKK